VGNKQIQSAGVASDNSKKRKRAKESSGASSDSQNVNADVEVETNNPPGPSKQQQQVQKANSQESGEIVKSVIQQPANLSERMKDLIESFVTAFGVTSAGGNVWTEELKSMLFRIYQESAGQPQVDRSNIFTYISNKTGKTKEVLMRHCRLQSNKLQNGVSAQPQSQQPQTQVVNRLPTDLKTAYYQKLNETVSPKVNKRG